MLHGNMVDNYSGKQKTYLHDFTQLAQMSVFITSAIEARG